APDRHRRPLLGFSPSRADAVEPLHREREREDDGDERKERDVERELLLPLHDRNDLDAEAEEPRREHGGVRRDDVVDEENRGERAVFLFDHRVTFSISSPNSLRNRARENVAACARIAARSQARDSTSSIARTSDSTVGSAKKIPLSPSTTVSSTPPPRSA